MKKATSTRSRLIATRVVSLIAALAACAVVTGVAHQVSHGQPRLAIVADSGSGPTGGLPWGLSILADGRFGDGGQKPAGEE